MGVILKIKISVSFFSHIFIKKKTNHFLKLGHGKISDGFQHNLNILINLVNENCSLMFDVVLIL